MIGALIFRFKGWLVAIATGLIMLIVAYTKGRKSGKESVEAKRQAEVNDALVRRIEVEADVAQRPDGDAAQRLRDKWSRD